MMGRKKQLIIDIENLLNTYKGIQKTSINVDMLKFMDEASLISIIDSLLNQKEDSKESDLQWLEKFKKYNKS